MSATVAPRWTGLTWQEFLDLPEDPALRHAQLVDGEVVLDPPTPQHQRVVLNLSATLHRWAAEHGGEVTVEPAVQVAERRGYLPDVVWFAPEQCGPADEPARFHGPPALAVEVLSPSTRVFDVERKRADYARVGVTELWLVDPDAGTALVLRRPEGLADDFVLAEEVGPDGVLTTPLLPGLEVQVSALVRRG